MKLEFLLITIFASYTSASKILFLFPSIIKSNLVLAQSFAKTLVERGHNVTLIGPFPSNIKAQNYREIISPLPKGSIEIMSSLAGGMISFSELNDKLDDTAELMIKMPEFQKLLNEESFDLLFIGMCSNDFLLGFSQHFKCPSMMLAPNVAFPMLNKLFGNPLEVNAVPHPGMNGMKLNFRDRVVNFIFINIIDSYMSIYAVHRQKKMYDKHFPSDRYPSYDEAVKNISMVLLNTHLNHGDIRPFVPAMVEVGGLQVKPTPDPLPSDIQSFLDGSKDGAILFSLGSNAKTTSLSQDKVIALLNVFSHLKQRVIMKWDAKETDPKPENVMIKNWLPQDDILAHPNVKLFISHGGLGGVAEAKYHAVPILGIPLFSDQGVNINVVVSEGWGVRLDMYMLTEFTLFHAIQEVLYNPRYASQVKRISELFRDRPMSARDTAVFWVEYVIRHQGAPHLKYPAVHQNLLQRTSIDVISFIVVVMFVAYKVAKAIICRILRCKRPNEKEKKKEI